MSVKQKLVTAEELREMPDVPGMNLELVDGEVVEVSPVNARHGLIAGTVYDALKDHVRQHDRGLIMGDNVGYVLRRDPDNLRAPDVSFVAWNNAPDGDDLDRFVEGPPTLAVEIVSPSDRATDIHQRVQDYLDAGTRLVWVLWPDTRSATAYDADSGVRELGPDAELDGGDGLLGFTVRVGELFDVRRRPQ
jgi:Uma2 family endonuclease